MASISLPAPGKKIRNPQDRHKWIEIGPCTQPCAHPECIEMRSMAVQPCTICGEAIGYDTQFYQVEGGQLAHTLCELRRIDEKRKGGVA